MLARAALVISMLGALTSVAQAQTDRMSEARSLAEQAGAAFGAGRNAEAAELFERSLVLSEQAATLYNLGLSYARLERDDEGAACFERFLELADASMSRAVEDATARLRAQRARVGRLRLDGVPVDAEVRVDDVPRHLRGRWLALSPGRHRIAIHVGGAEHRVELEVAAGSLEDRRLDELPVERAERDASSTGARVMVGAASPSRSEARAPSVVWSWALGAAALAAGGATIALGVHTQSTYDGLRATCAPSCADDRIAEIESLSLVTNVMIGVSGALAVATATALALELSASPSSTEVAVRVGPLSLDIAGRF
jgi:tetratricopeptide (TPR) repeat protein